MVLKMGDYIDQFVEDNPDLPGMDSFSKLMQRGTLPDRILEVEDMIDEQRKSYNATEWNDDE